MNRHDAPDGSDHMRRLILALPDQLRTAVPGLAELRGGKPPRHVVVAGMGGSAIGADILRTYLAGELVVPIIVNRTYQLPAFVDKHSLVIVVRYSGNTEETLSSYNDATKRGAQVIAKQRLAGVDSTGFAVVACCPASLGRACLVSPAHRICCSSRPHLGSGSDSLAAPEPGPPAEQ